MASSLSDALLVVAASNDLHIFDGDDDNISKLLLALGAIDVESCEGFRFAFVSDDNVDADAVAEVANGDIAPFAEVCNVTAESTISDGIPYQEGSKRVKRARPTHNVGGRLVFHLLEEYDEMRV